MLRIEMFHQQDPRYQTFLKLRDRIMPGHPRLEMRADAQCLLAWRHEHCVARASIAIVDDFLGMNQAIGVIGHYEAVDPEAGVAILRNGQKRLASRAVDHVVGPMNGSMWMPARFALPPEATDTYYEPPPFSGEPQNVVAYPQHWEVAGFGPTYPFQSRIFNQMPRRCDAALAMGDRLERQGVTFRGFHQDHFDVDMQAIFDLLFASRRHLPYYTYIQYYEFREQIEPYRSSLDSELIRFASRGDTAMAFVFAYPDLLSAVGGRPQRVIVPWAAATEGVEGEQLLTALIEGVHGVAYEKGYEAVIHALMDPQDPRLLALQHFDTDLFRRYALYTWVP